MLAFDNRYIVLWIVASLIACFPSLSLLPAALWNGEYLPVGNDAFYHARRILDAVDGNFYQFDAKIHIPEGSWLTWPWAYDYLLAGIVRTVQFFIPGADPMKILVYVPVVWLLVNVGLLTLIVQRVALPLAVGCSIVIAFACLPLNQALHGVGMIDHHFMELTFVLLSVWLGMRFFSAPSVRHAIPLGIAVGIAPGFHTSLFVLQLPILLAAGLAWLKFSHADRRALLALSAALFGSTLLIVLPSEPFQQLFFEYTTLSVFHLYIAACSSIGLMMLGWLQPDRRGLLIAIVTTGLLSVPLVVEVLTGANYLAGGQAGLRDIIEVASPFEIWRRTGSMSTMTSYYSSIILVTPFVWLWVVFRTFREQEPGGVFLYASVTFALTLLLLQFRFQSFGSWALLLAPALVVVALTQRYAAHSRQIYGVALLALILSFVAPVRHLMTERIPPAASLEYAIIHDSLKALADICRESPGAVLAIPDDGHPIRYQTDCSVIANNFLLTKQHGEKYVLVEELLTKAPNEIADAAPFVDYVLVHLSIAFTQGPNGLIATPTEIVRRYNPQLFVELSLNSNVPDGFELLHESRMQNEQNIAYAQIYRIKR